MNVSCPFCDSTDVEKINIDHVVKVPFCDDVVISHQTFKCNNCEEEGDFDNSFEKELSTIIDNANIMSAPKILEQLAQNGITMTYLEKSLRLPFRTTSRWKRGEISHPALALLRLIHFSPKLLEVADDNFSNEAVAKYQISLTWDFFKKHTTSPGLSVTYENNQLDANFTGKASLSVPHSAVQEITWESTI